MLVSSSQLSTFARQWGLDKTANVDLVLAKKSHRILSEALVAYIGAFYLDCCQLYGVSDAQMKVRNLCINLIDPMLDLIIKT
jgi:dsRNA-specific ribonuclease